MLHRRSALVAVATLLTAVGLVAACSAASGSPGAAATPTLNPNQRAQQQGSLDPSGQPAASQPAAIESFPGLPTPSAYAPDLEAMLPATVGDVPLQRFSAPASLYDVGGDICLLLCPGEPSRLAKEAGVPVTALTVAVAFPAQGATFRAAVIAIRFDGLDSKRSPVDVRIKGGGHTTPYRVDDLVARTTKLKVGSREVTWVTWPAFYKDEQGEYLLAGGNVLFIVSGPAPAKDGKVPDDIGKLVEALP